MNEIIPEHDELLKQRQEKLKDHLKSLCEAFCPTPAAASAPQALVQEIGAMTYGLALASEGLSYVIKHLENESITLCMFDLMMQLKQRIAFQPGDCTTDTMRREGVLQFPFCGVHVEVMLVVGATGMCAPRVQTEEVLKALLSQASTEQRRQWLKPVKASTIPATFITAAKALKLLGSFCGWISKSNPQPPGDVCFSPTAFTILLAGMYLSMDTRKKTVTAGELLLNLLEEFGTFDWKKKEIRLEAENVPELAAAGSATSVEAAGSATSVEAELAAAGSATLAEQQAALDVPFSIRLDAASFEKIGPGVPVQVNLNKGMNLAGNVTQVLVGRNGSNMAGKQTVCRLDDTGFQSQRF